MRALLITVFLIIQIYGSESFCFHNGGIGEYSKKCPDSGDFNACNARCQCFDGNDNPLYERDALCVLDTCFCVFAACGEYGRLITEPICCTKDHGGASITCDNYCDKYPEDENCS